MFALGIHEDTGSLTYSSATRRDADALAWCLRHGARQEVLATFLRTPLSEEERALMNVLLELLETHRGGRGRRARRARSAGRATSKASRTWRRRSSTSPTPRR